RHTSCSLKNNDWILLKTWSASFGCQHREENAHPTASQDARPARSAEDARLALREGSSSAQRTVVQKVDARPESGDRSPN
ncbi:hypothetical protein VIGAN_04087500, partial [Vigna angularis var. angularis]